MGLGAPERQTQANTGRKTTTLCGVLLKVLFDLYILPLTIPLYLHLSPFTLQLCSLEQHLERLWKTSLWQVFEKAFHLLVKPPAWKNPAVSPEDSLRQAGFSRYPGSVQ